MRLDFTDIDNVMKAISCLNADHAHYIYDHI